MDERDAEERERERRLRDAQITRLTRQAPEPRHETVDPSPDEPADAPELPAGRDEADPDDDASRARHEYQHLWVDQQIRAAMERGEFDDLPGRGKPLGDLGSPYDRDWWLKKLIEREHITGVLPPALQLRKEDAELDGVLDRETSEQSVRRTVEDFNRRVVEARRQLQGGPPVVTPTRDLDVEVTRWRERRALRRQQAAEAARVAADAPAPRRWWRRR